MSRYPVALVASFLAGMALFTTSQALVIGPSNIKAAIADSARPEADKQRDALRKPAETLAFADVRLGQKIGELLPGGGYFTRLFSKAVGPKGHVFALVPMRPANAPVDMPDMAVASRAIAADNHYSNVSVVEKPFGALVTPEPLDLLFTARNYHDLHNLPGLDVAAFNKGVFESLKPGGLYVILDHSAEAGTGMRDTSTLHRIDADAVKQEVTAAGFVFVASSGILANPDDVRSLKVFDAAVRGKTDQFILKFRKPK